MKYKTAWPGKPIKKNYNFQIPQRISESKNAPYGRRRCPTEPYGAPAAEQEDVEVVPSVADPCWAAVVRSDSYSSPAKIQTG